MEATRFTGLQPYEGLRVSQEQYPGLPDDGHRYDMIDGVLHMSPSATPEHGWRQSRFVQLLNNHLDTRPVGRCMVEVDVLLPDGGDVLRPDISSVGVERLHILLNQIHGTPDLVCEILSESTAERNPGEKALRYLNNGLLEYWIVDPSRRSIQLLVSQGSEWTYKTGNVLDSELLSGFQINVERFFN